MNTKKLLNRAKIKQQTTYTNLLYHKFRRLRELSRFRQAASNLPSPYGYALPL